MSKANIDPKKCTSEINKYLTIPIKEFIEKKKAKGIKKCVVRDMKFKNYFDILHNPTLEYQPQNTITQTIFKSMKHEIYTVKHLRPVGRQSRLYNRSSHP